MNTILAMSGIALVLSAHAALADSARRLDPHEQARQLVLGATLDAAAIRSTTTSVALAPTDPHELARQRIVVPPATGAAMRPTEGRLTIDPHERARRMILGSPDESGSSSSASSRWR
ncbi:hypothetical protein [Azospira restricta]|uniref:Uncharacterized protein n=1 Tax=Azospira restricta TaxID=404405 RepID=A0A974SR64_9RHOO|nr:hypothetical protein [Azospira restricta]QRJ64990.1 hypothetical protein IWH25_06515 [Azospira restricta]